MIQSIKTTFINGNKLEWNDMWPVNILGGSNGSGKTALLKKIYNKVSRYLEDMEHSNTVVDTTNDDVFSIKFNVAAPLPEKVVYINPDDVSLKDITELILKYKCNKDMTVLDLLLIDQFQTFISKYNEKSDEYKKLVNTVARFNPDWKDLIHLPIALSTGEKYILYLFLTVANIGDVPALLLIDDAGNHLHIDQQKRLLREIYNYNLKLDIIAATHCPSLIDGYYDSVKEISQLLIKDDEYRD